MSDDFLNQIEDDDEDMYRSYVRPVHPWVSKVAFWLFVLGGIAIGTCLFLFFLTLFVYVFLPMAVLLFVWFTFKKWQWNRAWKKFKGGIS